MTTFPSEGGDAARIEQEAADWIARHYAGLSPAARTEFQRWCASDVRHAASFAELDGTWRALDRVRLPRADRRRIDPHALAPRRPRRTWWFAAAAVAAAAVMALGGAAGWRTARPAPTSFTRAVATAVGEWRKVEFPDGSTVSVNTDTRIEVAYSAAERRVRLERGEAHFTVAKQPARPFFVEADGVAVRAVGTAFNVRLRAGAVEVLVTEGRVHMADSVRGASLLVEQPARSDGDAAPLLRAGERAVVAAAGEPGAARQPVRAAVVTLPEVERALAWQERRLVFGAEPLAEIVAEFNRYNRTQLVVRDPVLGLQRFGGSFRADQPETFVRLLEARFGLQADRRGEHIVLRTAGGER